MDRRHPVIACATVCILLSGCALWAPGEDPRGRDLVARGNDLVASIEAFQDSNGAYPSTLQELQTDVSLGSTASDFHFTYTTRDNGYSLSLNYTPSWPQMGRVYCSRRNGSAGWGCGGYL
jgi:hypothetical protein